MLTSYSLAISVMQSLEVTILEITSHSPAEELNCIGLCCPLPLIQLKVKITQMLPEQRLTLLGDDIGTYRDLPYWCELTGNRLVSLQIDATQRFCAIIEKSSP